jgi:hypothetical protein
MSTVIDTRKIVDLTETAIISNTRYKVGSYDSVCYQLHYTDATPAAKTFVAANVKTNVQTPASSITITAHGFATGLKIALTGTNLPTGLSATNYWAIVIDADTISLASSLANATAGTKVSITAAGTTADAALTPAALATTGFVVKLQQSNDGTNFFDVTSMTATITAAGDTLWIVTNPPALWHRIVITPTTGALTIWVMPCSRNNTLLSAGSL